MKKDLLSGFNQEQIAKIKACKSYKELLQLAKEEEVDLTQEQLATIYGGACFSGGGVACPYCGNRGPHSLVKTKNSIKLFCKTCNKVIWEI